jgi:lipopolysaccharide export system protein LptC
VTIKRSDFQLTGKKMEFNTETKQGRLEGDVKMIIFNMSDEMGAKPETKPSE